MEDLLREISKPPSFLDLERPDEYAASVEPLTFGKWKLAFYTPHSAKVPFLNLQGPKNLLGFLMGLAGKILLLDDPIPIQLLEQMEVEKFIGLILPEHVPEEQRNDGWYRFRHCDEYWRCGKR